MNYLNSIKALFNNQTFRKNAVQTALVLFAAVTGAVLADRFQTTEVVDIINTTEVTK